MMATRESVVRREAIGDEAGAGCSIDLTEERGITLRQLDVVKSHIERNCIAGLWMDTHTSQALEASSANLYHLSDHFIKPVTRSRQCSYVEFIARQAQLPVWFVSHWWGEPVLAFITCLRRHCELRSNCELDMPYWVCAYANNQWSLAGDVSTDPAQSAFKRAMALSVGTVTILDIHAQTYSRIWCGFEIAETLRDSSKLYDIVTSFQYEDPVEDNVVHFAVAITQGEAMGYRDASGYSWQLEHEENFPIHLSKHALAIRLQDAQATVQSDRRHILNRIAGVSDLDADFFAEHPEYDAINSVLRGYFAKATFRNAIKHDIGASFVVALRESHMKSIDWDFSGSDFLSDEVLSNITDALPTELETMRLQLRSCYGITDAGLSDMMRAFLSHFHLRRLVVDLYDTAVRDGTLRVFRDIGLPPGLCDLQLRLTGCHVTDVGIRELLESLRMQSCLESVTIRVAETKVSKEMAEELDLSLRGRGVDSCIQIRPFQDSRRAAQRKEKRTSDGVPNLAAY